MQSEAIHQKEEEEEKKQGKMEVSRETFKWHGFTC